MKSQLYVLVIAIIAVFFSTACQSSPYRNDDQASCRDGHPAHWWKKIDDPTAPDWEILPHEAGPCEVILSKRNELGILSNFADTAFLMDNKHFASLEGFWQAMKYPEGPNDERARHPGLEWPFSRSQVEKMTGFEAKRAGKAGSANMKTMGIDWVTYKSKKMTYRDLKKGPHYKLIVRAMKAKLKQNKKVRDILLKTGNLTLRPDHKQKPNTPPAWKYFLIWEELRDQIRNNPRRRRG